MQTRPVVEVFEQLGLRLLARLIVVVAFQFGFSRLKKLSTTALSPAKSASPRPSARRAFVSHRSDSSMLWAAFGLLDATGQPSDCSMLPQAPGATATADF